MLHARPNDLGHPRVGFSVSSKVGGAVRRNLVKRRLRAAVAEIVGGRELSLDLVVVARPPCVTAAFAEVTDKALLGEFTKTNGDVMKALAAYKTFLQKSVLPKAGTPYALGAETYVKALSANEIVRGADSNRLGPVAFVPSHA